MTHNFTTTELFIVKKTAKQESETRIKTGKDNCRVGFLSFSVHGVSSRTEITVFLHVVRTTIFSLPKDSSIFRL